MLDRILGEYVGIAAVADGYDMGIIGEYLEGNGVDEVALTVGRDAGVVVGRSRVSIAREVELG